MRQPPHADRAVTISRNGAVVPGFIRGSEPCGVEVSFDLVGAGATHIARRKVPFLCQFHVRNLMTGARLHLGNSMPCTLTEGQQSYKATLPSTNFAEGTYRMDVLVIVQSAPPVPGHVEVPMLQVV